MWDLFRLTGANCGEVPIASVPRPSVWIRRLLPLISNGSPPWSLKVPPTPVQPALSLTLESGVSSRLPS